MMFSLLLDIDNISHVPLFLTSINILNLCVVTDTISATESILSSLYIYIGYRAYDL